MTNQEMGTFSGWDPWLTISLCRPYTDQDLAVGPLETIIYRMERASLSDHSHRWLVLHVHSYNICNWDAYQFCNIHFITWTLQLTWLHIFYLQYECNQNYGPRGKLVLRGAPEVTRFYNCLPMNTGCESSYGVNHTTKWAQQRWWQDCWQGTH